MFSGVQQGLMLRPWDNPPNRFLDDERVYLEGEARPTGLQLYDDHSSSILSRNDSPDLGFRWSVNPYRGCQHACSYCYARPTHEYLSFGAGTDFDSKIVVKKDAARLLEEAFAKPSWRGETVVFSGVTDCYQPIESSLRITRACLQVCAAHRNPVGIITKSALIERDIDVLQELQQHARVGVSVTLPFADAQHTRAMEPLAPSPERRLRLIETLTRAGIRVGVMLAPIIPGLNDNDIPQVLQRAANAGAKSAGYVLLRLPGSVQPVFVERLRAAWPSKAEKILARIASTRTDGDNERMYDARFGVRQTGTGAHAEAIARLFDVAARRVGLARQGSTSNGGDHTGVRHLHDRAHDGSWWRDEDTTFRRPTKPDAQLTLW
jgi:DNA repair photolyase